MHSSREGGAATRLAHAYAGVRLRIALLDIQRLLDGKYDPNQPRVPAGQPGGGQWTSGGSNRSSGSEIGETTPQSIIENARRLGLAARPDGYQRCLDLCYPLLERPQHQRSDRNVNDFHKCMNACLGKNL